ncbi:MAG: hypothetical protein Ct9H300mP7_5070 [Verrucomicrobiota bacterium]|nr:MAG: hypothetical protein Ct9H300mP7_5070 [Verrucomicrobiota bacterium]
MAVEKAGGIQPIQQLGDQHLVALDLRTGRSKWDRPHDFSKLQYMTYLVYANGTLVAPGTDKDKHFHTYAIAPGGETGGGKGWRANVSPAG